MGGISACPSSPMLPPQLLLTHQKTLKTQVFGQARGNFSKLMIGFAHHNLSKAMCIFNQNLCKEAYK
jgi:hypothetical protein